MLHQVIQILHSILELIFQIYCSYMTFLYFSLYSTCYNYAVKNPTATLLNSGVVMYLS